MVNRERQTLAPAVARWGACLLVIRKPVKAAFKRSPGDDAFLTGFEGTFKSPAFLFARFIHRAPGLRPPPRGGARGGKARRGGEGWGGEGQLGRGGTWGAESQGGGPRDAKPMWKRGECGWAGDRKLRTPGRGGSWGGASWAAALHRRTHRAAPAAARRGLRRARLSAAAPPPSSLPPSPPKATETTAREEGKVTPGTSAGISPDAVMTPSRGATKPRFLRSGVPAAALSI